MDPRIRGELVAMQQAHDILASLTDAGRRRAVMWLAAKLGVDISRYDHLIAREALAAAEADSAD